VARSCPTHPPLPLRERSDWSSNPGEGSPFLTQLRLRFALPSTGLPQPWPGPSCDATTNTWRLRKHRKLGAGLRRHDIACGAEFLHFHRVAPVSAAPHTQSPHRIHAPVSRRMTTSPPARLPFRICSSLCSGRVFLPRSRLKPGISVRLPPMSPSVRRPRALPIQPARSQGHRAKSLWRFRVLHQSPPVRTMR
jgi:hypothetical protein